MIISKSKRLLVIGLLSELLMPPRSNNQPVAPINPANTGKGSKRTNLPNLKVPKKYKNMPVIVEANPIVTMTVAKTVSMGAVEVTLLTISVVVTTSMAVGTSCGSQIEPLHEHILLITVIEIRLPTIRNMAAWPRYGANEPVKTNASIEIHQGASIRLMVMLLHIVSSSIGVLLRRIEACGVTTIAGDCAGSIA